MLVQVQPSAAVVFSYRVANKVIHTARISGSTKNSCGAAVSIISLAMTCPAQSQRHQFILVNRPRLGVHLFLKQHRSMCKHSGTRPCLGLNRLMAHFGAFHLAVLYRIQFWTTVDIQLYIYIYIHVCIYIYIYIYITVHSAKQSQMQRNNCSG